MPFLFPLKLIVLPEAMLLLRVLEQQSIADDEPIQEQKPALEDKRGEAQRRTASEAVPLIVQAKLQGGGWVRLAGQVGCPAVVRYWPVVKLQDLLTTAPLTVPLNDTL
jgi:hypothetical protein